ncbi:MAG: putative flap endonuclease-1-like 5' DNA nuclease [Neolewinella sp.]|jgi:predicted flap endonuclease-1-like 5' DNA nuclease
MNEFFDQLNDLFALLSGEQALWAGFLAVLVFALGIIIGWIVQGSRTRRYKKELLLLRKDRDEYEVRYRAGETKQKALAKELEAVSREKVDVLDRVHGLENDLAQRDVSLQKLQQDKEELSASNQSYSATIESLNDQVIGLKTQNEQLLLAAEAPAPRGVDTQVGGGAGAGQESGSNENLNAYILASESRFQHLEERLAALHQENSTLKQTVPAAPGNRFTGHQPIMDPTLGATGSAATTEPLVIRADTTDPGVRTGNQGGTEVIVQTTPSVHTPIITESNDGDQDDLTRINNIGPFLQGKLYEADIYSYRQIANWSEADIVTYTELIGYIPGIIQRDDWVGQASALDNVTALTEAEQGEGYNSDPTTPTVININDADHTNLKLIEGIGPKIESVLKDAGISTMSVLAETSTERLREIMDGAGSRFKSHDSKTWPVQAGLADDGKFEELRAWQKEMKGGK